VQERERGRVREREWEGKRDGGVWRMREMEGVGERDGEKEKRDRQGRESVGE
jgi:hypothetical protein